MAKLHRGGKLAGFPAAAAQQPHRRGKGEVLGCAFGGFRVWKPQPGSSKGHPSTSKKTRKDTPAPHFPSPMEAWKVSFGGVLRCWGVVFEVLGCAFGVPQPGSSKRTPQHLKNDTPKALELRF